jgi:hypothetical protein
MTAARAARHLLPDGGRTGRTSTQYPHLAPMGQWGVAAAMLPLS